MDKYLIKHSTLEILGDLPLTPYTPFVLGVLGSSNAKTWNMDSIMKLLMEPLVEEQERKPEKMLLPADGTTSLLLETWAGKQNIEAKVYEADFVKLGRRARALRDAQILKEATHLLLFLGIRSDAYEKIAIREVKKGKIVYTVDPTTQELVEWVL